MVSYTCPLPCGNMAQSNVYIIYMYVLAIYIYIFMCVCLRIHKQQNTNCRLTHMCEPEHKDGYQYNSHNHHDVNRQCHPLSHLLMHGIVVFHSTSVVSPVSPNTTAAMRNTRRAAMSFSVAASGYRIPCARWHRDWYYTC